MNTTNTKPTMFNTDVEYIEAETAWAKARCARITAERRLAESQKDYRRGTLGRKPNTETSEHQRQLPALWEKEHDLRENIDARIAVTTASGKILGIDVLVELHGLDAVGRTTLLMATLAGLSEELEDLFDAVAPAGFSSLMTPEHVWNFMELEFADRIPARQPFNPTAALLRESLVTIQFGHTITPRDVRCGHIEITQKCFDAVLGLEPTTMA